MGFFDTLKKKVKETVSRADVALGGRLPGGITPAEAKAQKVPQLGAPIFKPEEIQQQREREQQPTLGERIVSGTKAVGETLKRGVEFFDLSKRIEAETGEPAQLAAGTLPIGPGGVGRITSGTKAITSYFGAGNKVNKARSVANTAKVFGKKQQDVQKLVDKALLSKEVSKIASGKTPLQFATKIGKWALGGVVSADILVSWYALDNVITGQKFFLVDLLKGLKAGTLTPDAAAEAIEDSQQTRDTARSFINLSTRINPLLRPFKNLIMTGVEADDAAAELKIAEIEALSEQVSQEEQRLTEGGEPILTGQQQFEENQATIAAAKEEANAAFEASAEARDMEEEAQFRERTLLFEAIRKRNAGRNLTPEEMALLEKYGLSTRPIQQEGGRSALSFGLLR